MNVEDAIKFGSAELLDAGIPDASRDTSMLLQYALGKERSFVIAHPEYDLLATEESLFHESIKRRAAREPLQYIRGRQEFYGLDFILTPAVLIPRPETEMIVERAIEILHGQASPRVLEIGVGSGCIVVSILKNSPNTSAVAVDVSSDAIDVARRNGQMHDVDSRVDILLSDVFEGVNAEKFDLIVSNPPYVPASDLAELQKEVRDHEPREALTDGSDGLTIVKRIVDECPENLRKGGHLLMEIGFSQGEAVRKMFDDARWESVEIEPDLHGIPRMVVAKPA